MRRFRISWLRISVVIVGCFSAVSIAQADNIGTLYTGTFPVLTNGSTVWQPSASQVGGTLTGNTQTLEYSVTFSAPITDFVVTPPCGPDCAQYFSGNLNSGSLSFSGTTSLGQDPYNFNGNSVAVMFDLRCSRFELGCSESAGNSCPNLQQKVAGWP